MELRSPNSVECRQWLSQRLLQYQFSSFPWRLSPFWESLAMFELFSECFVWAVVRVFFWCHINVIVCNVDRVHQFSCLVRFHANTAATRRVWIMYSNPDTNFHMPHSTGFSSIKYMWCLCCVKKDHCHRISFTNKRLVTAPYTTAYITDSVVHIWLWVLRSSKNDVSCLYVLCNYRFIVMYALKTMYYMHMTCLVSIQSDAAACFSPSFSVWTFVVMISTFCFVLFSKLKVSVFFSVAIATDGIRNYDKLPW